jgi:hypothetical protein
VSDPWFKRNVSPNRAGSEFFCFRSVPLQRAGLEENQPFGLNGTQQADERSLVKGQQKPKQLAKKAAQKTLKEKRQEKKAKKKAGGAFDH